MREKDDRLILGAIAAAQISEDYDAYRFAHAATFAQKSMAAEIFADVYFKARPRPCRKG